MVNILVAEDDRDDFLLLEEAIENTLPQFRITHARDGKDFLRQLEQQETPDMIFLDLNLPKKNGLDCLVELRHHEGLQTTPVVIYSTSSNFEDIDLCYKAGCTLYLVKPPSFKELLLQIKKLFSHELAEEAIRKSEEQFRFFMQASTHRVYKISPDWKRFYLLAGKELSSDSSELGMTWVNRHVSQEDQLEVWQKIKQAEKSKQILELEYRTIKANGDIGWTSFRAIPVLDGGGNIMEWFGSDHDITDRKRAEEELKEEHYFLEKITDNTPHLIYVFDLEEQRFLYINKRIQELTGTMQDYVYSMGPHIFKMVIHPEDLESRVDYFLSLSMLKQGEIRQNEFRLRVGKGYKWFRSKDHIFKIDGKKVRQVIGLAEDITFEKRLQEVLIEKTGGVGLN